MGGKKTKKQKVELSQAEIWDDSALVQSWDDALAEYKKYHSIHAQGQTINDVIENLDDNGEQAETAGDIVQTDLTGAPQNSAEGVDLELLEDGELKDDESERLAENFEKEAPEKAGFQRTYTEATRDQVPIVPEVPIAAHRIQDEALKNLMMSWYYAGYYTGLYEGQALPKDHSEQ